MSVQKAIFPGLLLGIFCLIGLTGFLTANTAKGNTHQANNPVVTPGGKAGQANIQNNGDCSISGQYPPSIRQWCSAIERYAGQNGLDPNLISAVMLQESAGKPDAYSKSGAVGLLQVMPRDGKAADFMCPAGPCFATRPSMQELYDPEFNISYGSSLLASLIQKYGDVREALKAYGPKDVGYYYADLVLNTMNSYR